MVVKIGEDSDPRFRWPFWVFIGAIVGAYLGCLLARLGQ
jgi:hypothetical protein